MKAAPIISIHQKRGTRELLRFYGPLPKQEAINLVDTLLDSDSLRDTLERYLSGEIEGRELAYELQVIAENTQTVRD